MPAIRRLPDNTTLRTLRRQKWTQKQIAKEFGVSEAAVWKALSRAGFIRDKMTVRNLIPWKIAPEHRTTAIMARFRSLVKQRQGVVMDAEEERLLNTWLHDLEENGLVVAYHPDAPKNSASSKGGFYYVPKTDQDTWIIRDPQTS